MSRIYRGMNLRAACSSLSLLLALPLAAQRVPDLPELPFNYADLALPDYYLTNQIPGNSPFQTAAAANDSTPADNPVTDDGATLGRVLFHDLRLSANGTVACASCHVQANGFGDTRRLSLGFAGGTTRRHSMGLTDAVFNATGKYFWDERAPTLEAQTLIPFQDDTEMGLTLEQLVAIVSAQDYYPELFTHAFGDPTVTSERIGQALAQFVRSLVSTNSRYDQGRATVDSPTAPFPNFTDQENLGKALFFGVNRQGPSCIDCHTTEAFISPGLLTPHASATTGATNNGLDAVSTDDLGIAETTGNVDDTGRFRVPSLRNVGVRAPYMHDGRFANLRAVVDFYATAIQPHPQLADILVTPNGNPARIRLNNNERNALVAFLNTLTDPTLLTDPKFSDPFVETTPAPDPTDPDPDPAPTPVTNPVRLSNLSSRARVSSANGALVSGFVVSGDRRKTLLIRGIGPGLTAFGLTNTLARPSLHLYAGDTEIASAGVWDQEANADRIVTVAERLGAFALTDGSADSAMLITVDPGTYTAHLQSADNTAGTGLIEIYDATPIGRDGSLLTNLSVRADLQTGGELLVPGFVVTGDRPRTFLIRATGPALAAFGISDPIGDPRLSVIRDGATIITNDNWSDAANAAQVADATQIAGAFALPEQSADAATLVALEPGAYTVLVDSADGSGGTLLVELYPVDL